MLKIRNALQAYLEVKCELTTLRFPPYNTRDFIALAVLEQPLICSFSPVHFGMQKALHAAAAAAALLVEVQFACVCTVRLCNCCFTVFLSQGCCMWCSGKQPCASGKAQTPNQTAKLTRKREIFLGTQWVWMALIQLKMSLKVAGLGCGLGFSLQCSKNCVLTFLSVAIPESVGFLCIQKEYLSSTWTSDIERVVSMSNLQEHKSKCFLHWISPQSSLKWKAVSHEHVSLEYSDCSKMQNWDYGKERNIQSATAF